MSEQPNITRAQSVINWSVVKSFALKVSEERRAGKFERVGEEFMLLIEAEVESVIRQIAGSPESPVIPSDSREFITGAALDKIREKLNARAQAIVQGKVMRHPSIGVTLKG